MTKIRTEQDRRQEAEDAGRAYLEDWDAKEFSLDHGEWASSEWTDERSEYDAALARVRTALEAITDAVPEAYYEGYVAPLAAVIDGYADGEDTDETLDVSDAEHALRELDAVLIEDDIRLPEAAQRMGEALAALHTASAALDGAVRPDESDYIAEGVIDPEGVASECTSDTRVWSQTWQGWDCTEGEAVYLLSDGRVVVNWWREAYGNRHSRDLYDVVTRGRRDVIIDPLDEDEE